jgi:hypothetical protein
MAAGTRFVTHVTIDKAVVTVTKDGDEYRATLTAKREPWTGVGRSVAQAIEAALDEVRKEKRWREKGRPSDRYRIARSLL